MTDRIDADLSKLEIRQLSESNQADFANFTCGDDDLDDWLKSDALRLQAQNIIRTSVAYYDGQPCGFVALMADAVVLETKERKSIQLGSADHPVVPAVKIARLGMAKCVRESQRGCGTALVRFAFLETLAMSRNIGCRLLTLDAYPNALGFYEKLGFKQNKAKEYREKNHPSMRLDVFAPALPTWVRLDDRSGLSPA